MVARLQRQRPSLDAVLDVSVCRPPGQHRVTIVVAGDLVAANASQLRSLKLPLGSDIELSLPGTMAVDRPGFAALLSVVRRARRSGVAFRIRATSPALTRLWRSEGCHRLALVSD